jgi:hypothetical protein
MNERINDLRLEAGIGRLHEVPYMVAVNKEGELIEPLEGLQKFAQLIVRECMKLNSQELSITAIERLLPMYQEHFGVES